MKEKLNYEDAKLEVIFFPSEDIVTASMPGQDKDWEKDTDTSDGSWV